MKMIQGNKAHFGRHTFEATADVVDGNKVTRLTVFESFRKKYVGTYFFNRKQQLIEMSNDKDCALQFFTGSLSGTRREEKEGTRRNKKGRIVHATVYEDIPKIDYFLSCFKHDI